MSCRTPAFSGIPAEVLERYRHDERVMVVNGTNYHFGKHATPYSYYFSRYFHCWGFATWRRAWNLRREGPALGTASRHALAGGHLRRQRDRGGVPRGDLRQAGGREDRHLGLPGHVHALGEQRAGDHAGRQPRLEHRVWRGPALHSHDVDSPYAAMQTFEIDHPLKHPPTVLRDLAADRMQYAALIEPVIRQAEAKHSLPAKLRDKARAAVRRLTCP